jgi:hypothetical protein
MSRANLELAQLVLSSFQTISAVTVIILLVLIVFYRLSYLFGDRDQAFPGMARKGLGYYFQALTPRHLVKKRELSLNLIAVLCAVMLVGFGANLLESQVNEALGNLSEGVAAPPE